MIPKTLVGMAREVITPRIGVGLCGYFVPRMSRGVFDDLYVRATVIDSGGAASGIAVCDLVYVSVEITEAVRAGLRAHGLGLLADSAIVSATHTHTGPYVQRGGETGIEPDVEKQIVDAVLRAFVRAWAGRRPAELSAARVNDNPFAFNRRKRRQDGAVVTNPAKRDPEITGPESVVDDEIAVLAIRQEGRLAGLFVNIVNHTDTVGGDFVSADWPGRMERALQGALGQDLPVTTLIGCSGNVNHLDWDIDGAQTDYEEAGRIGRGYAEIVAALLEDGEFAPLPDRGFKVKHGVMTVARRVLDAESLRAAREILAQPVPAGGGDDMTSVGLARGDGAVKRFFAAQLVEFADSRPQPWTIPWTVWRWGEVFGLATLPGEPFTEIGLAIKEDAPSEITMVAALAMGSCGYVPMKPCFACGGYETLPRTNGGAHEDTASMMIETIRRAWD